MGDAKELQILVAEDDDGHATLISRAFKDAGFNNRTLRFVNGEQVWRFLSGEVNPAVGEIFDPRKRYLLLMDINMPRMDGIEVLKRIRADAVLKGLLVIMLTTTDDPREVQKCYNLGCNAYMTKPSGFSAFAQAFKHLGSFLQVIEI